MGFNKNPGLWVVIMLAVVGWNLYELFGPQPETPPQSIMILNWVLLAGGAAGLIGAVMQLMKQKDRA